MKSKICTPGEYRAMSKEGKYVFHSVHTFFVHRGGMVLTRILVAYEEIK